MKINDSNNLAGVSAQFLRVQKQRQAAREAATTKAAAFVPQAAQKTAQAAQPAQVQTSLVARQPDSVTLTKPLVSQPSNEKIKANADAEAQAAARTISTPVAPAVTSEVTATAQPAETAPAAAVSTPAPLTAEDLQSLLGSFGRNSGDEGFTSRLDLNNDGTINTQDLTQLLARLR